MFQKIANGLSDFIRGWVPIAYLLFFALLNIYLGQLLALSAVTAAGGAGVALAAGLSICHGLKLMWLKRMDRYAIVVQAQTIRVETMAWLPVRLRPYRLIVQGIGSAADERVFRSNWMSSAFGFAAAPDRLNVLVDSARPSRYFVDIRDLAEAWAPRSQRWLRVLRPFAWVFMAFLAEDCLVSWLIDTPDPPRSPVRGEVHVSGPDVGNGVNLGVNACRMTRGSELAALVFASAHDPFPQASIIRSQHGDIGAFEIKPGPDIDAIRFDSASCSRIRGDIRFVTGWDGLGGLLGYADAECVAGRNTLSIHVDFSGCLEEAADQQAEGEPAHQ